jgi:hypothetical protein
MTRLVDVDAPPIAAADELLAALAAALRAWIGRQVAAEERLTAFAFREGQPEMDVPQPTSIGFLAMHALAVACEPSTARFLRDVRGSGRTIGSLAPDGALGVDPDDRVALAARVGALAAAGLVGRELESDRISATPLAEAILDLLDDLERRMGAP